MEELIADGLRLMDEAESNPRLSALGQTLEYRDGLIVAFLGFHPMRLRNLAGLEVGGQIVASGEQYLLSLSASETKGGQPYEAMRRLTRHRITLPRPRDGQRPRSERALDDIAPL
jgi:hypothetical protein